MKDEIKQEQGENILTKVKNILNQTHPKAKIPKTKIDLYQTQGERNSLFKLEIAKKHKIDREYVEDDYWCMEIGDIILKYKFHNLNKTEYIIIERFENKENKEIKEKLEFEFNEPKLKTIITKILKELK